MCAFCLIVKLDETFLFIKNNEYSSCFLDFLKLKSNFFMRHWFEVFSPLCPEHTEKIVNGRHVARRRRREKKCQLLWQPNLCYNWTPLRSTHRCWSKTQNTEKLIKLSREKKTTMSKARNYFSKVPHLSTLSTHWAVQLVQEKPPEWLIFMIFSA